MPWKVCEPQRDTGLRGHESQGLGVKDSEVPSGQGLQSGYRGLGYPRGQPGMLDLGPALTRASVA